MDTWAVVQQVPVVFTQLIIATCIKQEKCKSLQQQMQLQHGKSICTVFTKLHCQRCSSISCEVMLVLVPNIQLAWGYPTVSVCTCRWVRHHLLSYAHCSSTVEFLVQEEDEKVNIDFCLPKHFHHSWAFILELKKILQARKRQTSSGGHTQMKYKYCTLQIFVSNKFCEFRKSIFAKLSFVTNVLQMLPIMP